MQNKNNHPLIGVIGLGAIGLPIASNLLKAGYDLKVYSRSERSKNQKSLEGAIYCKSPKELALDCKIILICVSDDNAVENIIFGFKGLLESIGKKVKIIDCSTISPNKSRDIYNRLKSKEVVYLDAPVTGGTEGAKEGNLTILVGGDKEDFTTVKPILNVIGSRIIYLGKVGSGQEAKMINQILIAGIFTSLAEAIVLGQKCSLPMEKVLNALSEGAASSWALSNRSKSMINNNYPLGFKVSLHNKDLAIALQVAKDLGLKLPLTSLVKQLEESLLILGKDNEDISVLKLAIEKYNETRY